VSVRDRAHISYFPQAGNVARLALQSPAAIDVTRIDNKLEETYPIREGTTLNNYKQHFKNLVVEDSGQDLIEYALVAALVGLGSVAAISGLDNTLKNTYNGVSSALTNATA
jgi:pilus assembly protein Flp/PilA